MKALVTGATGFIGSRLVERLCARGDEVVALARRDAPWLPKGVRGVQGDILAPESLGDAGRGCQRLYHLAALVTFDPRRREELLRVNGQGTANVLAAARRWGVERCVVVSSAITLGISRSADTVLDEDATPSAADVRRNPYLASKLEAEKAAIEAARGQHVVIANPTTVYGPGDRTLNSGTLIAKIARSRLVPVPPGGSNVVDVDDVVEGILAAGESGASGRRYVLGGANLPFADIFATIADVVGRRPRWLRLPRCARGPMAAAAWLAGRLSGNRFLTPQIVGDLFAYKYYSSARAAKELAWQATRPFRDSVERACAFYRQERLL
ncbi:MAG TPA: NAD-dependent epimerase/dehydratase family protein [Planctomycetota bacterium]|nr:NAD-dependent epimerase/dehydratase family protein [Planctomycetota bacterium]